MCSRLTLVKQKQRGFPASNLLIVISYRTNNALEIANPTRNWAFDWTPLSTLISCCRGRISEFYGKN